MQRGFGNSVVLVLLGCVAWIGNTVYANGATGSAIKHYSPGFVALAFAIFFVWHCGRRYGRLAIVQFVVLVFVVGWIFETLSVTTGVPFGRYHYTETMSPFLGHVPVFVLPAYLFMGYAAWSMATLVLGVRTAALPGRAVFLVPLVAAGFMGLWDLSMDPLRATVEGRWIWINSGGHLGVPWSNFVGWIIVTWCMFQGFAFLIKDNTPKKESRIENDRLYWASIPVMFTSFAGEYLLNPLIGHGLTQTAAGQPDLVVQDIFWSVAMLSWVTFVPVLLLGLALAIDLPRWRVRPDQSRRFSHAENLHK